MSKTSPTGGGWSATQFPGSIYGVHPSYGYVEICEMKCKKIGTEEMKDNAAHIVKCVNGFSALVEQLKSLREDMEMLKDGRWDGSEEGCDDSIEMIDRVLAGVGEEE